MDDFPADEAELAALMNVRSRRGRFDVAEEYFYRKNAASFTYSNFHVSRRGRHHWDVIAPVVPGRDEARRAAISEIDLGFEYAEHERAFVIRGEPGAVTVADTRWNPLRPDRPTMHFRTLSAAMLWISEELMFELEPPRDDIEAGDRT